MAKMVIEKASPRLTLTVEEMCEQFGISKPHGLRMLREGRIPAKRLGKRWIIGRKALEDFLAEVKPGCGD